MLASTSGRTLRHRGGSNCGPAACPGHCTDGPRPRASTTCLAARGRDVGDARAVRISNRVCATSVPSGREETRRWAWGRAARLAAARDGRGTHQGWFRRRGCRPEAAPRPLPPPHAPSELSTLAVGAHVGHVVGGALAVAAEPPAVLPEHEGDEERRRWALRQLQRRPGRWPSEPITIGPCEWQHAQHGQYARTEPRSGG